MKDLNFFNKYIQEKKEASRKSMIIFSIVIAAILLIGGSYAAIEWTMLGIRMDISDMTKYINSAEIHEKQQKVNELKSKIEVMGKYKSELENATNKINEKSIIGSKLIIDMNNVFPKNIILDTVSYTSGGVLLEGKALNRIEIAMLAKNLDSLGMFFSVNTMNIQKKTDVTPAFAFQIDCKFKDVMVK